MEQRISPGQLINLAILRQYSKEYGIGTEQLTKYIDEEIASDGLSARKIARMRDAEDFPSLQTIKNLSDKVKEVSILDPETACERLLLDFSAVEREQEELIKPSNLKITIVAGWSLPQALTNENIANTLASNINKGVSYEFIYPSFSIFPKSLQKKDVDIDVSDQAENYLTKNLNDLFLEIYKRAEELDSSDTGRITKATEAINRTAAQIKFVSTQFNDLEDQATNSKNLQDQATLFWVAMPSNYVVLYNIGEEKEFKNIKRGSFFVEGQSFRDDRNEPSFKSKGWIHMDKDKYKEIEEEYTNLKNNEIWKPIEVDEELIKKELS
jgi:hypothetical protein